MYQVNLQLGNVSKEEADRIHKQVFDLVFKKQTERLDRVVADVTLSEYSETVEERFAEEN